jgi:hypothetical protein
VLLLIAQNISLVSVLAPRSAHQPPASIFISIMAALPVSSCGAGMVRLLCTRALRGLADATITLPNGRTMDVPEENISFSMPGETT